MNNNGLSQPDAAPSAGAGGGGGAGQDGAAPRARLAGRPAAAPTAAATTTTTTTTTSGTLRHVLACPAGRPSAAAAATTTTAQAGSCGTCSPGRPARARPRGPNPSHALEGASRAHARRFDRTPAHGLGRGSGQYSRTCNRDAPVPACALS